jgi:esterase/lipase superfamily enzyme
MRWIIAIISAASCAFGAVAKPVDPNVVSGVIRAHTFYKTTPVSLRQNDRIDVTAVGSQDLALDVYVYAAPNRELAGKSDDDSTDPFSWTVTHDGQYYVVLRNSSDVNGEYRIRFLSSEGKSVGNTTAGTEAVLKVFYATDRRMVKTDTVRGTVYGAEFSEDLAFGICSVRIPRAHQMGELEGPSIWRLEFHEDASKHVVLLSTQPETAAGFFRHVSERVGQSEQKEALVFVHGFNTDFESAARRAAQISYDLGFAGATVLYSWPSQGQIGLISYNKDGRNAELSVPHFNAFLSNLASKTGARRIHVIAHSMGNRVVVRALSTPRLADGPHIQQLALLAPDIDAEEFRRLAVSLKSSADHVTLYASSRDEALQVSERLAGYPRAGEGEPHIVLVPGIDTVDASAVDTSVLGLSHSYFADNQTILSDLFYLIRGSLPANRVRLRVREVTGGKYWAFMPAVR